MDGKTNSIIAGQPADREIRRGVSTLGTGVDTNTMSPLEHIRENVLKYSRNALELALQLQSHADRIHGHVSSDHWDGVEKGRTEMDAPPALIAISLAFEELNLHMRFLAEQAGRNTTLV